jgi:TRAP-type uncharacterized transport system fused permease subunit
MYLGMMSFLTPPVAIAAYFAASMANAPAVATRLTAMRFSWTAYVVPFLFVFSPSLLLEDRDVVRVNVDIATAVAGVWLMSAAMIGYMLRPLGIVVHILVFAAGVLFADPLLDRPLWVRALGQHSGRLAGYGGDRLGILRAPA